VLVLMAFERVVDLERFVCKILGLWHKNIARQPVKHLKRDAKQYDNGKKEPKSQSISI
jgi:hypothetical protein